MASDSTRRKAVALTLLFLPACGGAAPTPRPSPSPPFGWVLAWSDDFEGPVNTSPDPTKWAFDVGGHGWGNQELQTYTKRIDNASLDGTGLLLITARQETLTGPDRITRGYTSARLKTLGLFERAYGRFEARMRLPAGQGIWPAFWMLGADFPSAGWPACGEIDVMENIGREPSVVHASVHGPGYSGATPLTASYQLPSGARFAEDFHVFSVEWEPNAVRFYIDGILYFTVTPSSLPAGTRWVFDHPFFMLLNVAVGGSWPGPPDATTAFPQTLTVDYVRVYRRG